MKNLVLIFLLFGLGSPANAFWGATEEEKAYCRNSASGERNEWSAKQTYKYCLKEQKEINAKRQKEYQFNLKKANLCIRNKKKYDKANSKLGSLKNKAGYEEDYGELWSHIKRTHGHEPMPGKTFMHLSHYPLTTFLPFPAYYAAEKFERENSVFELYKKNCYSREVKKILEEKGFKW